MDKNEIANIFESAKNNIKEQSKYEKCIKSISFSSSLEEKYLIIYLAWNKINYSSYFNDRILFINAIKAYLWNTYHLKANISKSTSSKLYLTF